MVIVYIYKLGKELSSFFDTPTSQGSCLGSESSISVIALDSGKPSWRPLPTGAS